MMEDTVLITVDVIDVSALARELYGKEIAGRPIPEHDYRFQITWGNGGRVTFHREATAEHVYEHAKREGLIK